VGTTKTSLRLLACTLLLAAAAFVVPQAASASKGQLSLIQDDRELFGELGEDPAAAMAEIKALGVDVVRTNIAYYRIYRESDQERKPDSFDAREPDSAQYDWSAIDRLINLADRNGLRVLATVTGPGPNFTSGSPRKCRRVPCAIRPSARGFGAFVQAVAKRYRGQIDYYSLWNEPNLSRWIRPQGRRSRNVQKEGIIYRKLWQAGYKQIARYDRPRRNRVLFGEVAAIGDPLPLIQTALCLDRDNRPLRGRDRRLAKCGNFKRMNIGGIAVHPYNFGGFGRRGPQTKTGSSTALPIAYMPRLHRLTKQAVRRKRMRSQGRRVFITEYGYQTRPPDPNGVSLRNQAEFINETDRLTYGDRLVKTTAQYELVDVREAREYNSGLRFTRRSGDAERKPAYEAYRLPLVVTKRSSNKVEIYGQVRPGSGRRPVQIQILRRGEWERVKDVRTNGRGFLRTNVRRRGASRQNWRLVTLDPVSGGAIASRTARAGKRLRYYRR
jgi:hypothetical protein